MRRVFISFKMEDKKQVDGVRLMAWNKNLDLDFYDESVRIAYKSDNDDYIKKKIRAKIDRASITVCFLGPKTYLSEWVNWELTYTLTQGKPVFLMGLPNGPERLHLPPAVAGKTCYKWNPGYLAEVLK